MKNKKWFWYPDFLSKQGLLFEAKKEIRSIVRKNDDRRDIYGGSQK